LVAPGVPNGTPATTITRCPALAKPSLKAMPQALEVYRRTLSIHPRIERIPDLIKELRPKVEGRDI